MNKLVLDDPTASQLAASRDGVELVDPSGHTLGYFIPASPPDRREYEEAMSQWTDAELDRRASEPGGKTTLEVLKKLSEL